MLNADLQDLARRWGASDVPFTHEIDAWVDAPELVLLRRHLDHAAALRTPVLLSGPMALASPPWSAAGCAVSTTASISRWR